MPWASFNHYICRSNRNVVKEMGGSLKVYENEQVGEMSQSCDRYCCYRKCRLDMVGGGRCTPAGCLCYESFFVEDQQNSQFFGAPASIVYPEDKLWYLLSSNETEQIQKAIIHHRKNPSDSIKMCKKE